MLGETAVHSSAGQPAAGFSPARETGYGDRSRRPSAGVDLGVDADATVAILNKIMQYELAGVVRYTHSALTVRGPFRAPIVQFMQGQAAEACGTHRAGEILTGLGGHPDQGIAPIEETLACHHRPSA